VETFISFNRFLSNELQGLDCNDDTRAYIIGVFDQFRRPTFDFSMEPLGVLYAEAKNTQSFQKFSNIGDWLFIANALFPEHLNAASEDYYYTIGQMSYWSCYKLLNRQWKLYQELSDRFPELTEQARELLVYSI
jgi:hypothetical protein